MLGGGKKRPHTSKTFAPTGAAVLMHPYASTILQNKEAPKDHSLEIKGETPVFRGPLLMLSQHRVAMRTVSREAQGMRVICRRAASSLVSHPRMRTERQAVTTS